MENEEIPIDFISFISILTITFSAFFFSYFFHFNYHFDRIELINLL